MNEERIPLTSEGWNELWKAKQARYTIDHDAEFWNKRAKSFTNKDAPGSYTDRFLQLADIREGENIMDMGCGTGNLAIPLAQEGHDVLAADFSSVMLERLQERMRIDSVRSIRTIQLSWYDDWADKGIEPKSFDVCLASRSVATNDLEDALVKLSTTAKRYVCITLSCDSSPRIDDRALREIGLEQHPGYDDVYALAILQGLGFLPKVDHIKTERVDAFDSFDAALEKYTAMLDTTIEQFGSNMPREEAVSRLKDWLRANLIKADSEGDDGEPSRHLTLKTPRSTTWAFLSWEV